MKLGLLLVICIFWLSNLAHAQQSPLCSIRTVFIEGKGSNYKWVRKNLEKKTWLRIENIRDKADGILEVWGVGSEFFPVNVKVSRREPEEFLWEEASSRNPFGLKAPRDGLLRKLNKSGNCQTTTDAD